MKIVFLLASVLVVGWIAGCETAPKQVVTVPLNATIHNSGHTAQATLTPIDSSKTKLVLFVGRVPRDTAIPAHLYTYVYSGTCTSHESKPAYKLNQFVSAAFNSQGAGIRLGLSVPVAYDTLHSSSFALVVRTSPGDGNRDIFCANFG